VLPGLHELFLQGLRPEHCIAVPLEHTRFLPRSLHDILQRTTAVTCVLSILRQIDYSRASTNHLHPLLGLAHRFQVSCYRRRVDKVVCQEFNPTTTTRGGSRHRRRVDWLRILNLRRTDDYFQGRLWQYIFALLSDGRGGFSVGYFRQLGGCSGGSLGLRRQTFNGHRLRDGASLGFGPCQ
jgi:hypothetical protein